MSYFAGKIKNSCGLPGCFSCELGAKWRVSLPFKTTKTPSQECSVLLACMILEKMFVDSPQPKETKEEKKCS